MTLVPQKIDDERYVVEAKCSISPGSCLWTGIYSNVTEAATAIAAHLGTHPADALIEALVAHLSWMTMLRLVPERNKS